MRWLFIPIFKWGNLGLERIEETFLRASHRGRIWTQICFLKNPFMLLKSFRIIQESRKTECLKTNKIPNAALSVSGGPLSARDLIWLVLCTGRRNAETGDSNLEFLPRYDEFCRGSQMTQLILIFEGLAGFLQGFTEREWHISGWRLNLVKEGRIGD